MGLRLRKLWAVCALLLLAGCGGGAGESREAIDYNQYIYSRGWVGYTEDAYIFFNCPQLQFLEPALSAPLSPLCSRADCSHRNPDCSAYLNPENRSVFASGGDLYYLGKDSGEHYGLYRMDIQSGERSLASKLPILDFAGDSFGYSYYIYGSYMTLELNRWREDGRESAIYLLKIGEDGGTDLEPIFGGEGDRSTTFSGVQMRDGWIFVWGTDTATGSITLYGYDMEAGEARPLVEDWQTISQLSLRDDTLYWFEAGVGFFSTSLEGGEAVLLRACDPQAEYGAGVFDDQYLYLSTSIAQLDAQGTVPEEKRGLSIYDYQGNLLQFIPATEEARHYAFLLSTPEYVFFYSMDSSVLEPVWYLRKADIAAGTAELIPME